MAKQAKKKLRFKLPRINWFTALRWVLALAIIGATFIGLTALFLSRNLPNIDHLGSATRHPSIRLLSVSGQVVASFGDVYGDYIPYKDIPLSMIQAVVATEDRRFFDHFGIDIWGILRAAAINARAGHVVQGGSTITQQLAKNIFLTPERSYKRKLEEVILALWLEHKYTKEQILEMYLNRVYLGASNYGIDAAARSYFSKRGTQLNIQESAILAGLLKAPTRLSPANDPDAAAARGRQVLESMHEAGFISKNMVTNIATKIEKKSRGGARNNYYFADWIVEQLPDLIGAPDEDITVVVTLDPTLQKLGEDSVNNVLNDRGKVMKVTQGALVSIAPDGKILAMVGGRSYAESQFNRVTQAKRQPGSAFKMFVYLTAFMNGFSPNDVMEDKPVQFGDWKPENYDGEYTGPILLRDAMAKSINSIAAQLANAVGINKVIETARSMGIRSNLEPVLSLALGTSEVNLLEMTGAYAVLANSGVTVEPYGIIEIRTSKGEVLYTHQDPYKEQIIPADAIAKIDVCMMQVLENGTGRKGKLKDRDVAAKSGTSQDFRDAWFLGFTPQITTGVWMGNDNNAPTDGVTGGGLPAMAFHNFMEGAHDGLPALPLPVDARYVPNVLPALKPYSGTNEHAPEDEDQTNGSFWNRFFPGFNRHTEEQPAPPSAPHYSIPPATPSQQRYPTGR